MLLPKLDMHCMPPSPSSSNFSSNVSFTSDSESRDQHERHCDEGLEIKPKKRRIRQNLSHLSHEEKLSRRKMKNRVAAQSARDRKKAKMDEVEAKVARMSEDRIRLTRENERLRKRGHELEEENTQLRKRLCTLESRQQNAALPMVSSLPSMATNSTKVPTASIVKKEPSDEPRPFLESAALINASQQQKQESVVSCRLSPPSTTDESSRDQEEKEASEEDAFPWMMPFVCWLVAIQNLMRSSTGWRSALTSFLRENMTRIPSEIIEVIVKLVLEMEDSTEDDVEEVLKELPPDLRDTYRNWSRSAI